MVDINFFISRAVQERQQVIFKAMEARAEAFKRIEDEYQNTIAAASSHCEQKIAEVLREYKEATSRNN